MINDIRVLSLNDICVVQELQTVNLLRVHVFNMILSINSTRASLYFMIDDAMDGIVFPLTNSRCYVDVH